MEELSASVIIQNALQHLTEYATTCLEFITDNALLMTVFAGGIISSLAFRFIRKSKRVCR